jgi:chromosome segregation protein
MLRRLEAGRATFLPLSALRGRKLEERGLLDEPGFVGIASDLVTYKDSYADIVLSLLGRVVVVEDMDAAIALARRKGYRFRIVTLAGGVIAPGGAMTGGSLAKNIGLLSRKNEIETLKQSQNKLEDALTSLESENIRVEQEAKSIQEKWETAAAEKRSAEDESLSIHSERAHKGVRYEELKGTAMSLEKECDELAGRLKENANSIHDWEIKAIKETERAEFLAAELAKQAAGQSELFEEATRRTEQIAQLRTQTAVLMAEKAADDKLLQEYESLHQTFVDDNVKKDETVAALEQRVSELRESISHKQEEMQALRTQIEERHETLSALYAVRQSFEGRRVQVERKAREGNETILGLERERSRLEAQKTSAEAEEKAIIDRLWDHYGLTHSAALPLRKPLTGGAGKSNRRVSELKAAIQALGPPNIGAIEEYERVSGRYTYMTGQRDDAAGAKTSLLSIIEDLTEQMKHIFLEQFALIGEKFTQVFKEIFGGGDAKLSLEDPDDVLGCDVAIHAQPPGKKMRTITLLSGGEKSLVAIALYFAISKVRPAPFCVLDEVDHDLDDINVSRFASYLRRMSSDIQFIVMTHRRGTMEAADMLYGVTTQEEGVSKILSMRLEEAEKLMP